MSLTTVDALYIALGFLVPGYVIAWVRSLFLTRRPQKTQEQLVAYLALSAINFVVASPLVLMALSDPYFAKHPALAGVLWLVSFLVVPSCIGFLLGIIAQKDWLRRWMVCLGVRPVHVIPTAWDWQFSRLDSPSWVIVTFKDGSSIAGYFGQQSFASSEPGERDIVLEKVFDVDDNGEWSAAKTDRAVLVVQSEIRCIEFFLV